MGGGRGSVYSPDPIEGFRTVNRCGPALLGYTVGLTVSLAGVGGLPCTSLLHPSLKSTSMGKEGPAREPD